MSRSRILSLVSFVCAVGLLIGGFVAEEKSVIAEVLQQNGWLLLVLSLLIFLASKLAAQRIYKETVGKIFSQRRARITFMIICAYFIVGLLDVIILPIDKKVGDKDIAFRMSILDIAFEGREAATYSAPLADKDINGKELKKSHLFGTDIVGKDVMMLAAKGCSTALLLSFGCCLILFPIAIFFGITSGYFGGWIDDLITWFYSTVSSIPFLLMIIALLTIFGRSLTVIIIAMGITSWVGTCRLLRGETFKHRAQEYVTASRVQGAGHLRIITKHILPNVSHILVIQFTLLSSNFIIAESILSFIGVGLDSNTGSWGAMIAQAQGELMRSPNVWWPFVVASFLGIFPIVLSLNIFGDVVRDALDPKLRNELVG